MKCAKMISAASFLKDIVKDIPESVRRACDELPAEEQVTCVFRVGTEDVDEFVIAQPETKLASLSPEYAFILAEVALPLLNDPSRVELACDRLTTMGYSFIKLSCRRKVFGKGKSPVDSRKREEELTRITHRMCDELPDAVDGHVSSIDLCSKYWSSENFTLEALAQFQPHPFVTVFDSIWQYVANWKKEYWDEPEDSLSVFIIWFLASRGVSDEFTKAALSQLSLVELDQLEIMVSEARNNVLHEIVFGGLGSRPTMAKAKAWLNVKVNSELDDEQKRDVVRTLRWLRDEIGYKLYFVKSDESVECNLGVKFRNDFNRIHFRLRKYGELQTTLCERTQLPENLTLRK